MRERLGEPACGPTANTLCTYGGPVGIASRWAVVFDLNDGSTRITAVLCFDAAFEPGEAVPGTASAALRRDHRPAAQ